MNWGFWKPYVPVAKRRAQAARTLTRAMKSGQDLQPVAIQGRAIARTFWGKAWCDNLEAYSDYENRLPRGRTYVRNGAVLDLRIEPGKVRAQVAGSSLYQIEIGIAAVPAAHWQSLVRECTGSIASLVELLQGRFSEAVMQRICEPGSGLFPAPRDIGLACSCPDWASMCKHVAAVLYGVGARLDKSPDLLFTLRQVDASELVTQAVQAPIKAAKASATARLLDDQELADVFGIELAASEPPAKKQAKRRQAKALPPAAAPASAKASKKKSTVAGASKQRTGVKRKTATSTKVKAPAVAPTRQTNPAPRKRASRPAAPVSATRTPGKKAKT